MQPKVKYKGKLIKITSIWWGNKGDIRHICFHYKGEIQTIFNNDYNFDEIIIWEKEK